MKNNARLLTRREMLLTTLAAGAAMYVPRRAWGASESLNVACIGSGGKGRGEVLDSAAAGANIVGLCDVDEARIRKGTSGSILERFPKAKFYRDFRKMLDEMEKTIHAVTVSTPDHTHFVASMAAMQRGKHVYTQKPLTKTIYEARQMALAARKYKVATQMGNQGHAQGTLRRNVELIRAGIVGRVSEVHVWTNRPIWPQGMPAWPAEEPVPATLDWDLWTGPAKLNPYSSAIVPFRWRGFRAYGCGALGDMACHLADIPYWALDLRYPTAIEARQEGNSAVSFPKWQEITYTFSGTKYTADTLTFVWHDGVPVGNRRDGGSGKMPDEKLLAGSGVEPAETVQRFDGVAIGEKGRMFFSRGRVATDPGGLLQEVADTPEVFPRPQSEDVEWQAACKGGPPALGNFDYSSRLTEFVLAGDLPVALGKRIEWDGESMKATNAPEADALVRYEYRKGWEVEEIPA
jgi:predicted dehydrogenase